LANNAAGWHEGGGAFGGAGQHRAIAHAAIQPDLQPIENVWNDLHQNKKLCAV
jgi:hypothetical protein